MSAEIKFRWGWLKFMYLATIVFAGVTGLVIIIFPDIYKSLYNGQQMNRFPLV